MRHTNYWFIMSLYAQAIMQNKRDAQTIFPDRRPAQIRSSAR